MSEGLTLAQLLFIIGILSAIVPVVVGVALASKKIVAGLAEWTDSHWESETRDAYIMTITCAFFAILSFGTLLLMESGVV